LQKTKTKVLFLGQAEEKEGKTFSVKFMHGHGNIRNFSFLQKNYVTEVEGVDILKLPQLIVSGRTVCTQAPKSFGIDFISSNEKNCVFIRNTHLYKILRSYGVFTAFDSYSEIILYVEMYAFAVQVTPNYGALTNTWTVINNCKKQV
jgi:hypothetical protein